MRLAALALFPLLAASALAAERYDGPAMSFEVPPSYSVEVTRDISADVAVRLSPPSSARKPAVRSFLVLASTKKIGDGELESEAAAWHAAHVKNRAAWGMRSEGGSPRDVVKIGGRRAVRYRDQVGSALGASEQTLTCVLVAARLACVIANATPETRDTADSATAQILSTLSLKRR